MLLILLISNIVFVAVNGDDSTKIHKPYVVPFPLELPTRNDRSDQCWLRIEDAEITETITVYCHIAQSFLINFIRDYNSRKMMEDTVYVSLWSEDPRPRDNNLVPNTSDDSIVDWKLTTIMDPTTHRRLYVTKNAECKLIMYSREGMTNYEVDCEKILYFVNVRMNSSTTSTGNKISVITFIVILINSL
ncbi:uncharacterized protein LOC125064898 [Vanessa atalanta]|uniref:uncharacterized protein LOC125064898 n=1 Tax=Vanessa atalanta TaxID=42275 RepID=UPI001FCD07C5|nr:uncharacterized protein LOC125064898 [Vanessa atalanta]